MLSPPRMAVKARCHIRQMCHHKMKVLCTLIGKTRTPQRLLDNHDYVRDAKQKTGAWRSLLGKNNIMYFYIRSNHENV